uniref:Ribosomal L1 domain-containing protein CG13096 n=1 Tax=Stomoxys calcitrans TaxID=35570 RepID=A0A1I8P796_STOCA
MVKVQKPLPKSIAPSSKTANKAANGIKKEKPGKDVNVKAKKAKAKLMEQVAQEKQLSQTKSMKKDVAKEQKNAKKNKEIIKQQKPIVSQPTAHTEKAQKAEVGKEKKKFPPTQAKSQEMVSKQTNSESKPPHTQSSKKQKNKQNKANQKPKQTQDMANKPELKSQIQAGKQQKKKKPQPKTNKVPKVPSVQFEPMPFDEEQFNKIVNLENIKKVAKALKKLVEKEVSEKKTSIFSDYRYFLNVSSYKIPNCPKRMVKLNVKHSLVDPKDDDVVIIVPDLQRGAKMDHEPTVQHYEDLFREAGVSNLKIVPFNQLRKECTTYEAKRKFANTYDYFLCDGRIVGHVVGFCGKNFQKPRTTFHAVGLTDPKTYKKEIERALKRTAYKQIQKGDLVSIPVGNHRYSIEHLAENVQMVVEQLKTLYPGGLGNIRQMNMKIDITGTSSLPLYVNLAGAPAETPNVVGSREQRMLKLKKEANDVLEQFNLSKSGEFVKLDRTQVERKRQIKQARQVLIAVDAENEETPSKKAKKDNEEEDSDNGEAAEEDEVEEAEGDDEDQDGEDDDSNDDEEDEGDDDDDDEDDE